MNPAATQNSLHGWVIATVVVVFLGFRLYLRFRSTIGPQRVSEFRLIVRAAVFGLLGVFLLLSPGVSLAAREGGGGGMVLGLLLGALGLYHTRFEKRGDKPYYVPNTYIGMGVSLLFIGRIVYRIVTMYPQMEQRAAGGLAVSPWADLQSNPLTLGMFEVVVGYYIVYNIGLVVLSRRAHTAGPVSQPVEQPAELIALPPAEQTVKP